MPAWEGAAVQKQRAFNALEGVEMTKYQKMASMASALALAMSVGTASAQSTSGDSSGASAGAQGGGTTSSSMTFQQWLNAQSGKGRITRQMYMDEAARRWDMMDKEKRGLTASEINSLYYSGVGMGGPTANKPNEKKGIQQ
jgi:hypothetical protein